MGLLNNREFSKGDYLFIILGIAAGLWFFVDYAHQDPRSIVDASLKEQPATLTAAKTLSGLGYSVENYEQEVKITANTKLLDSLQAHFGRREAIDTLSLKQYPNIYPYYWQVIFTNTRSVSEEILDNNEQRRGPPTPGREENTIEVRLDTDGRWIEILNRERALPASKVNRQALKTLFIREQKDISTFWPSMTDSALTRLLYFDLDQEKDELQASRENFADSVRSRLQQGKPYRYTVGDAFRLAEHHVKSSGWDLNNLREDTVSIQRIGSVNAANVQFENIEPVMGQHYVLRVKVAPAGALLGFEAGYNTGAENGGMPNLWELSKMVLVLLFGIWTLYIFYFRLRARAVDTRPALVVSVIAGLLIPIVILLYEIDRISFFETNSNWNALIGLVLRMGVVGALSSLAFFVLTAIGDSITRQHWPQKLSSYDYLRQGMIFNQPIGVVLVRSVILAFMLTGLWSALSWGFPQLYYEVDQIFLSDEATWSPLLLLFDSFWFSLIVTLCLFLVVGSQFYAYTKNQWTAGLFMILGCALMAPFPLTLGPGFQSFLILGGLGIALVYIFIQWDFLTLLVSHFLFIGLITISSGWLVSGSPDTYVFVSFLLFMAFITTWGTISILKGKEERVLPRYVPEYVEELAQEERIKQELEIARQVQQSFLPSETPRMGGLDLAALCQPAYETGGDYYDFIQLDDHRIALTIGDVSGKGIQAAFYMTFTKGIIHSLCRETDSPAELLKKANRLFFDNARRGTFISLVYGIIDVKKQTFTFARAGHNPVIRLNSRNGKVEELQPGGLGLGLTKETPFDNNIKEIELTLTTDDLLVLYTDGVTEALNEAHQFYGSRRLIEFLKEVKEHSSAEILSELSADVTQFIGKAKQHDDMTMMIVKLQNSLKK